MPPPALPRLRKVSRLGIGVLGTCLPGPILLGQTDLSDATSKKPSLIAPLRPS